MILKINPDDCASCAACVSEFDTIFELNDDMIAVFIYENGDISDDGYTMSLPDDDPLISDIDDILDICPTEAIYKEE